MYLTQEDDQQRDDDVHRCRDIEGQAPGDKCVMVLCQPIDKVWHNNLDYATACSNAALLGRENGQVKTNLETPTVSRVARQHAGAQLLYQSIGKAGAH